MQEMQERRIPSLVGKIPGGGNGRLLQYSCLGKPMDREGWWAAVHGVSKESNTTGRLSTHAGCVQLAVERETEILIFQALIEQFPE